MGNFPVSNAEFTGNNAQINIVLIKGERI